MNKKQWIFGISVLSALILIMLSFNHAQSQGNLAQRGKYLVENVAACGSCHTPRAGAEPDMSMHLAGHPANAPYPKYTFPNMMQQGIFMITSTSLTAFSAPFGTVFAANLTPDKETGLGEWTEKMFIDAIRTGFHMGVAGNRKILPPMPTKNYANMTDDDLKAIWAYLKTVKSVKNEVPPALNNRGRPF
jgi:hypothetical protein